MSGRTLFLLLLTGCFPTADYKDGWKKGLGGVCQAWPDADGDGFGAVVDPQQVPCAYTDDGQFVFNYTDCDDEDPAVFPNAPEVCDGLDQDCDGQVDEDVGVDWYLDMDGDGYGAGEATLACDGPTAEWVNIDGDCNDGAVGVNPGAAEVCNDVDNDCDGVAGDEDGDGDGTVECEDCNDTDATVFPGADERCNGLDDDCDEAVDEAAVDQTAWYQDGDGDGYGTDDSLITACEAPAEDYSDLGGDCDDTDDGVNPGQTEVPYNSVDEDCDPQTPDDDLDGDGFGVDEDCQDTMWSVYPGSHEPEIPGDGVDTDCDGNDDCDDLNCDGYPDIVFGGFIDNASSSYRANGYIYYGAATGYDAANVTVLSTYGVRQVAAEDLDGDGYVDLVFPQHSTGLTYATTSDIYWGGASGHSASSVTSLDTVGAAGVCLADFDQDGHTDIAFPAWLDDDGYEVDTLVYPGSASGYSTSDVWSLGTAQGVVDCDVGDVDGDGWSDLVLAGYNWDDGARDPPSYVFYGSSTGLSDLDMVAMGDARSVFVAVHDLDGDGADDVAEANLSDDDDPIESMVWWGASDGLDSDPAENLALELGSVGGVLMGDVDGDGAADLVYGLSDPAETWEASALADAPQCPVFLGSTGTWTTPDFELPCSASYHISAADIDGDGRGDLVFSNYYSKSVDGSVREISSPIYWGVAGGFDTASPTLLDTSGSYQHTVADLDGDGAMEIIFGSWIDDLSSSSTDSFVYWNLGPSKTPTVQVLPTMGVFGEPLVVGSAD